MKISVYANKTDSKPKRSISLKEAYEIVKSGTYLLDGDIKTMIEKIRNGEKELKSKLPIFTFSGEFKADRKKDAEFNYSQYLCLDIDNLQPERLTELYKQFKEWEVVNLVFISPSGNGLKVVFNVNTTKEDHEDVYTGLMLWVSKKFNLPLRSKDNPDGLDTMCKDVARACFISYDSNAHYNGDYDIDAEEILIEYKEEIEALNGKNHSQVLNPTQTPTNNIVEFIVKECEKNNINLIDSYQDWFTINSALNNSMGSNGLDYFIRLSKLDTTRFKSEKECISKYNNYKSSSKTYTIASLIYLAIKANITLPDSFMETNLTDYDYIENWLKNQFDFRINSISDNVEFKPVGSKKYNPIDDYTENEWKVTLSKIRLKYEVDGKVKNKKLMFTKSDLSDIIHNRKFSPEVNPVVEYFNTLSNEIEVDENQPLQEVEKWINSFHYNNGENSKAFWMDWFYGVVKNLTTNNYYDRMIVLSGKAGTGKTFSITSRLCQPFQQYFTSSFNWSTQNKDELIKLSSYLFIFDDELKTSKKTDVDTIKAITSYKETDIRKAYGKHSTRHKRIANFIGATNNKEFLTDLTGNRRFLVFDILGTDRELINSIDYKKLWAEVWNYYYINKNESDLKDAVINENNESYRSISVEEEALTECFDFSNTKDGQAINFDFAVTSFKDIIDYINGNTNRNLIEDNRTKSLLKSILSKQGIEQTRNIRYDGKQGRWWFLKLNKNLVGQQTMKSYSLY